MNDRPIVKLGNILTESAIISEEPNSDKRITVKLNCQGVEKRPFVEDKKGSTRYFIRKKGQFIYGKQNLHNGAFGIIPDNLDNFESSADLPAFDISPNCRPEWLVYFFQKNNFYRSLTRIAKGVGTKRIYPKQISNLEIPLPSTEIQDKLIREAQQKKLLQDALSCIIQDNQTLSSQLRESILQDAIQGKLVPQDDAEEPASALLERIHAHKSQLIADKVIKKSQPLDPITADEIPFELPKSREWVRLGEIVEMIYGKGLTKNERKEMGKYPVYGSNGIIGYNDNYLTSKRAIIIGRKGSAGALNISEAPSWTTDVAYFVEENELDFLFLYYLLQYLHLEKLQKGIKPGLNRNDAYNLIFPLPPLAEQHRIVAKLDQLMTLCDDLDTQLSSASSSADLLMQSVLNEVFE